MTTAMTNMATAGGGAAMGVEGRLRRLWARHTRLLAARGGCWVLAALGGLVLADLALDWQLDLAGWQRMVLLAANLGVLVYVGYRELVRRLDRYDAVDLALAVERAWPGLNGLVVSCVQFGRPQEAAAGVSRELMQAVRRQAAARTATVDFGRACGHVVLGGAVAAALAATLALAVLGVWRGQFLWVLGCRMVNPACQLAYPTRTGIEVLSGNPVVRLGEPVTLAAQARGEIPAEGKVYVRMKGGGWEVVNVAPAGQARFQFALPRVTDDVDYYFRLGDARSPRHRVTVARPPRIVAGSVRLDYPAYTRLAGQEVHTLNLKAPEGTRLTWRLKLDRPVLRADLRPEGAQLVAMAVSPDGLTVEAAQSADASRSYTVAFHWNLADRQFVESSARHYIQVVPDAEPQVGLLRPTEDTKATLSKSVELAYWARDDYGLEQAWIVYAINDGEECRFPLERLGGRTSADKEFSWPITTLLSGLKVNDIVTFAVEVADGRPGQSAGRGRSISRRVQFLTDNEYVAYILARQRKLLGQLRPLYLQEKEAAGRLEMWDRPASAAGSAATPPGPSGAKEGLKRP